jgi:hypothetical protein
MGYGQDYANAASQILENLGRAQAQGIVGSAQAWGQGLQNVGQTIAAVPQQLQAQKTAQQENALRAAQLADYQAQATARALANQRAAKLTQAYVTLTPQFVSQNADGSLTTDRAGLASALRAQGFVPEADDLEKNGDAHAKAMADLATQAAAVQKSNDEHLAAVQVQQGQMKDKLAAIARTIQSPSDFVTQVFHAATNGVLGGQEAQQYVAKALSTPTGWQQQVNNIIAASPSGQAEAQAAREKLNAPLAVPAGGSVVIPGSGQVISSGGGTSEQDDQRYRSILAAQAQGQPVAPPDLAWANAYKTQKTLGPEASAAAATDRQTATISAQTAQQQRAQNFTEMQAGRAALEKTTAPYLDAQQKAATLRNIIDAAQGGNVSAANLQGLMGALDVVSTNGVHRINNTEVNSVQGAGSLVDRLQGWLGKATAGQPIPPQVQDDLKQVASLIEQGARTRYEQGYNQIIQDYPAVGKTAKMLPGTPPATGGPSPGTVRVQLADGRTGTVPAANVPAIVAAGGKVIK